MGVHKSPQLPHLAVSAVALLALVHLSLGDVSEQDDSRLTLLFAGDANLNNMLDPSNLTFPWAGIRHVIDGSDAFLLNHEGEVTNNTHNVSDPALKDSPAIANSYLTANVSFVALANNHQADYGRLSVYDTMGFFKRSKMPYAGVGRTFEEAAEPAILVMKGKKVAVFATMIGPPYDKQGRGQACWPPLIQCDPAGNGLPGVHYIPNVTFAAEHLIARANSIRDKVDYVIMFFHWGSNWDFMDGSSGDIWKERQWLAHRLLESRNVDMIWGTSAHHIQPIEIYNGKPIIYGLGNLMIPLPADLPPGIPPPRYRTRLAFLYNLALDFTQQKKESVPFTLEAVPIVSDDWKIDVVKNTSDLEWLFSKFNTISKAFGTKMERTDSGKWFVQARGDATALSSHSGPNS
ncbi:hypothetical protein CYMTET_17744 [Cymbomonas tetramitiformis]|uniref:Capsule synthesis protein CapA domain-containing protein n=1 Tax=Cymbomonas tetramitiformis TaxID=36881 RepID=A0AAE0L6M2_9CHLO|nr:hypothetical protein CYMTET_17744 [Cymbomonas tetramitiformis]|eukprot:gene23549-28516_t